MPLAQKKSAITNNGGFFNGSDHSAAMVYATGTFYLISLVVFVVIAVVVVVVVAVVVAEVVVF